MNTSDASPMVPLSAFLPQLLISAPQIPEAIAESYIRDAAILLAEQALLLKRRVPVTVQAGCKSALLEPPDCTHTLSIDEVCDHMGNRYRVLPHEPCWFQCRPGLNGASCDVLPAGVCLPGCLPGCGPVGSIPDFAPFRVWFEQPNHLHIVEPLPQFDVDPGLWVRLSVAPDRDACELDELIYQRYAPVVVAGALSLLYLMPNPDGSAPWSAPALAKVKDREFKVGCARALGDQLLGPARGAFRATAERIV